MLEVDFLKIEESEGFRTEITNDTIGPVIISQLIGCCARQSGNSLAGDRSRIVVRDDSADKVCTFTQGDTRPSSDYRPILAWC
jgi:hypothetical protein